MVARNRQNEIRLTRVYDAPVAVVWNAFLDPGQIAQWWGPRCFTLTYAHQGSAAGRLLGLHDARTGWRRLSPGMFATAALIASRPTTG